jgi:hypothetical protein
MTLRPALAPTSSAPSTAVRGSLVMLALALATLTACGDAVVPAPPSSSTSSGDAGATSNDDPSRVPENVVIEYQGKSITVDVNALPRQDYKGSEVVSLGEVWDASELSASLDAVEFEFEGDDGFRPSARDRCKAKISGAQLPRGYVLPETRTLVWDDALGLPGCYSVKLVAKVIVTDKP